MLWIIKRVINQTEHVFFHAKQAEPNISGYRGGEKNKVKYIDKIMPETPKSMRNEDQITRTQNY